jgi:hypothetical protein
VAAARIQEGGGEAMLCEARILGGMMDQEIRSQFNQTRDADYDEIGKQARELAKILKRRPAQPVISHVKPRLAKLRGRFAPVHAID